MSDFFVMLFFNLFCVVIAVLYVMVTSLAYKRERQKLDVEFGLHRWGKGKMCDK